MKEIHYCYCGHSGRHDKGPECEKPRMTLSADKAHNQDEYEAILNAQEWPKGPSSADNGDSNGQV